jgi:hypothetical protein
VLLTKRDVIPDPAKDEICIQATNQSSSMILVCQGHRFAVAALLAVVTAVQQRLSR